MSPVSTRAPRASLMLVLLVVAAMGAPPAAAHTDRQPMPARLASASAHPGPAPRSVARHPNAVDVLVDKRVGLPAGYRPPDLVVPDVPFIFSGFDEKRQVRRVAARALERLFAAASGDGVGLAGVSGYRSEATQRSLFSLYTAQMGRAAAARASALPGHSEHQTGLAIDVAGADGRCPATACFAATPAARWIARHAPRYGFVVRYPANGEASTGYEYEPWHLRYLGRTLATAVASSGLTYEEYLARGKASTAA